MHNEAQRLERTGSFRLDEATYKQLEEVAEADERPVSYLVRLAIEQYLRRRSRPSQEA